MQDKMKHETCCLVLRDTIHKINARQSETSLACAHWRTHFKRTALKVVAKKLSGLWKFVVHLKLAESMHIQNTELPKCLLAPSLTDLGP
ncbi:TPA: hypothetical protein ACH3X1_005992 [Trebouxia sp. C0004]